MGGVASVDAGTNVITAPIQGVGHLADGNVGGALQTVLNSIAPPPPPPLPPPPPPKRYQMDGKMPSRFAI